MNTILTSTNTALRVTGFPFAGAQTTDSLSGLPLGTSDGTATGQIGAKVILLNSPATLTGGTETPTATTPTVSGSVAAGARSIVFIASPDFTGTILGATFTAYESVSIAAQSGNTLGAIAYVITTGSLRIIKTV